MKPPNPDKAATRTTAVGAARRTPRAHCAGPIIPGMRGAIAYGGDYNPEQWPESWWPEDVRLMREAGVNLLTVGVFSWARLQPTEEVYDFDWLDRLLDLLAANEMKVCLATATASPPPWLSHRHPAALPMTADGITLQVGSRQHYSPSSPAYRRFATELVVRLARRYGRHPALAAWHINNEYACHVPECHNADSTRAFRRWLRTKYGTLAALNAAWGTAFWSQAYGDWEEIFTPRRSPYHKNPAQCLDFRRFTNEAYLALHCAELKILRRETPAVPVTTNFMGFFKPLDYFQWARYVDFVSWDSYPDPLDEVAARRQAAAGHDLMRSLRPDRPFVLMEQATSAVNWRPVNRPKRPGLMRLGSLQALARGGDGAMFFQWRASRAGTEKYHSAILQHAPTEDSRVFREVKDLGRELGGLSQVGSSVVRNRVAIAMSWEAWWALELEPKPGSIDYAEALQRFHGWFYDRNIGVDFVRPGDDLTAYAVVVAPALYLLRERDAANLERYVHRGGQLVVTYFSGIVDENEQVVPDRYPAFLRRVLGLWVEEWVPYSTEQANRVRFGKSGRSHAATHWCEVVHPEGAQVLATFGRDYFAGGPAVTRNSFGAGSACYLATRLDEAGLDHLLRIMVTAAGLRSPINAPRGVEVTVREGRTHRYVFLLNHNDRPATVNLGNLRGHDLLRNRPVGARLRIGALDATVLEAPHTR